MKGWLLLLGVIAAQTEAAEPPGKASALEKREIRAQLMPRRYTTLAAEIGAKVNRLPLQEGSRFQAGHTLLAFDCVLPLVNTSSSK